MKIPKTIVTKKSARGMELYRLITEANEQIAQADEQKTQATQRKEELEVELNGLFSDAKPKKTRKRTKSSTKTKRKTAASGNGSGRGELITRLRAALKSMPTEFTSRELMAAASIEEEREASAFAAISRMDLKLHEIRKGAPGKYRRA